MKANVHSTTLTKDLCDMSLTSYIILKCVILALYYKIGILYSPYYKITFKLLKSVTTKLKTLG